MNSSDEHSEGEVERSAQFWIEGVLTPLVGISGVAGDTLHTCNIFIMLKTLEIKILSLFPGNIICILVLTKKKKELGLKPSFTHLLILLVSFIF